MNLAPPPKQQAWVSSVNLCTPAKPYTAGGQEDNRWQSSTDLAVRPATSGNNSCPIAGYMNQGAALCDRISSRFNEYLTQIDAEDYRGEDVDVRAENSNVNTAAKSSARGDGAKSEQQPVVRENHFGKASLYSNSRLPPHLLPFKAYMPTWRLLCLAAQASQEVYQRPRGAEREAFVNADYKHGTKAMVLKSIPFDDQNTIVFAIRGSQANIVDWAVNFRQAPASPENFLDDPGNMCHSGFLHVAHKMVKPVAARLRQLLEQDPSRAGCSLVITGHSAGGAVASLLYMHMLSESEACRSELTDLTDYFKRVHCITFGTPPVSMLPLQKPTNLRHKKSVFLSFINQGDPIVRADMDYLGSLMRLYAAAPPNTRSAANASHSMLPKASRQKVRFAERSKEIVPLPKWKLPAGTLSNAGRLVVLREKSGKHQSQNIEAVITTDDQLRETIFGDLDMHWMKLYRSRIDELAIATVTGRGMG